MYICKCTIAGWILYRPIFLAEGRMVLLVFRARNRELSKFEPFYGWYLRQFRGFVRQFRGFVGGHPIRALALHNMVILLTNIWPWFVEHDFIKHNMIILLNMIHHNLCSLNLCCTNKRQTRLEILQGILLQPLDAGASRHHEVQLMVHLNILTKFAKLMLTISDFIYRRINLYRSSLNLNVQVGGWWPVATYYNNNIIL